MSKFKNRDYKFRVWDGETMDYCDDSYSFCIFKNKVHEVDYRADYCQIQNFAYETADVNLNPEDCAIMQYTGLKDKNKKEVYEGDVVKFKVSNFNDTAIDEYVGPVGFENGIFYFGKDQFATNDRNFMENTIEVIGNIYENSELLK